MEEEHFEDYEEKSKRNIEKMKNLEYKELPDWYLDDILKYNKISKESDARILISLINDRYKEYQREIKTHALKGSPLYLFSFKVFLAYKDEWRMINRMKIRQDEFYCMMKLDIYKLPRIGNFVRL